MRLFFAVLSPCLLAAGLVLAGLPGKFFGRGSAFDRHHQARDAEMEPVQGTPRGEQGCEVHSRRCLGDDLWSLQGEFPTSDRDASEVRR